MTLSFPGSSHTIEVLFDNSEVWANVNHLMRALDLSGLMGIEVFPNPRHPEYISREGMVSLVTLLNQRYQISNLIHWMNTELASFALSCSAPMSMPDSTGVIRLQDTLVRTITENEIIYYKVNDIMKYVGNRNAPSPYKFDYPKYGIKGKGKTNPAWYINAEGCRLMIANTKNEAALLKIKLFFNQQLPVKYIFPESFTALLMLLSGLPSNERTEAIKHFRTLLIESGYLLSQRTVLTTTRY